MEKTDTFYNTGCKLFKGASEQEYPDEPRRLHGESTGGFSLVAHTEMCPTAAIADEARGFTACSTIRRSITQKTVR